MGRIVTLEDSRLHGRDSLKYVTLRQEALKKGMAFLIISTGVPLDLYFTDDSMVDVDNLLQNIFEGNLITNLFNFMKACRSAHIPMRISGIGFPRRGRGCTTAIIPTCPDL